MATVLHIKESALPQVLTLLAGLIAAGQVVPGYDDAEVDLYEAARRLGLNYYAARRLIVTDKKIRYRRKTAAPKSPVLVRVSAIEAYKQSLDVEPPKPKKRHTNPITAADIMLGA